MADGGIYTAGASLCYTIALLFSFGTANLAVV